MSRISRILLKAVEDNWCLIEPGEWETTRWEVRRDMSFTMTVSFRPINQLQAEKVIRGILGVEDYYSICRLIESPWSEKKEDACDGITWEFMAYGKRGALVKHRPMGYAYDIEPYESIISVLEKQLKGADFHF